MDAQQIQSLKPRLQKYLNGFRPCLGHSSSFRYLKAYVTGQLSDLHRKSIEPMANAAGLPPRSLQEFLSLLDWDEPAARDRLQRLVVRDHGSPDAIGLIDDTGHLKKGRKTPGVAYQYCGRTAKVDHCVVTVHLGYAVGDFHCLLDAELFLPQAWSDDPNRCRAAGVPAPSGHRPKWQIALDLLDRTRANGLHLGYLTFDEDYGKVPEFLFGLEDRGQRFVGEVSGTFAGFFLDPHDSPGHARHVMDLVRHSPRMTRQAWERFYVKQTTKGPVVWEVRRVPIYLVRDHRTYRWPLLFARNVLHPDETKYLIANVPDPTPTATLLAVAFSRWNVEQCFAEEKDQIGLSHFEVRNYRSLRRHLVISALSELFLATVQQEWGKKNGRHRLPGPHRRRGLYPGPMVRRVEKKGVPGPAGPDHHPHPAPVCPGHR